MYRLLKILHLLGLTLFLGSIFGHIVASVLGGEGGSPAFLFARQHVSAATWALTMPGLGLAIATGIGMVLVGRISPLRARWLAVHALLATLVLLNAGLLVVPAGVELLHGATALHEDSAGTETARLVSAKFTEDIAGAVNVMLALGIIILGVWKPKL
jgi:hypothetical protein